MEHVTFQRYAKIFTFQVYNLYPDYVYPGRIIRVDIDVQGAPEEDKIVTVEIEIHGESDLGFYRWRSIYAVY